MSSKNPREMKTTLEIFVLLIGIFLLVSLGYCYWKTSSELDSMSSELDSIKKLIKIQNNLPTTITAKTTTISTKTATKTPSTTTTSTTTTTTFKKEEFKPKCDEYERDVIVWVKCGKIRTEEEMNTFIDKIRSNQRLTEDLNGILFLVVLFIVTCNNYCQKKTKTSKSIENSVRPKMAKQWHNHNNRCCPQIVVVR